MCVCICTLGVCECLVVGCVVGCGFDLIGLLFVCLGVHVHRFVCVYVRNRGWALRTAGA